MKIPTKNQLFDLEVKVTRRSWWYTIYIILW